MTIVVIDIYIRRVIFLGTFVSRVGLQESVSTLL